MKETLLQFAASEAASGSFLDALGIDWKLLVIQSVAFLILLLFLSKFVYPPLARSLEKREEQIEASTKAAVEAEKKAAESKDEIAALLKDARDEAADIVTTAREEAAASVEAANQKAKKQAEAIVQSAHSEIEKDIESARKALKNETLELVATATEKVTEGSLRASADDAIIKSAVAEAK